MKGERSLAGGGEIRGGICAVGFDFFFCGCRTVDELRNWYATPKSRQGERLSQPHAPSDTRPVKQDGSRFGELPPQSPKSERAHPNGSQPMSPKKSLFGIRCLAQLFMLHSLLNYGCMHPNVRNDPRIIGIFSDFAFVGSGSYSQGADPQTSVALHGQIELPRPDWLQAGRQYIFHHPRPADDQQLALSTLPRRIKAAGFNITSGPSSPKDLMFLIYGGPLFKIQFEGNGRKGLIFNKPCPQLTQTDRGVGEWVEEDYMLVITSQ